MHFHTYALTTSAHYQRAIWTRPPSILCHVKERPMGDGEEGTSSSTEHWSSVPWQI